MRTRLQNRWARIRSSFWFVPVVMTVLAVALSTATVAIDDVVGDSSLEGVWGIYAGGPAGARTLLLAIAGSMIGVAGVVFSITIVALSLASSQFGPRLLRNFMRDTANQIVLGTFVATFIYCLLVLRTVGGEAADEEPFVPHISVTIGVLLSLASLTVLIYFIHHIAASIQAPNVIAGVARDLDGAIARLLPLAEEEEGPTEAPSEPQGEPGHVIARHSGYLQAVDTGGLVQYAAAHGIVLRLLHRPGHFATLRNDIALVWPAERLDDEIARNIERAFILGNVRTLEQDVEFAINQLVEVAVRALSPGINDPMTAITCIDRLGAALCRVTERRMPSPYRYDGDAVLRVIENPVTFESLVDASFNQVRQHAATNVAVTIRLLEALEAVAHSVQVDEDRSVLRRHAEIIKRGSREQVQELWDRSDLEQRYRAVLKALGAADDEAPLEPAAAPHEVAEQERESIEIEAAEGIGP